MQKSLSSNNTYSIYLYYNKNKHLEDYAIKAINMLKEISNHVLIVVNGGLNEAGLSKLSTFNEVSVLFRENIGYDFGGYKDGILFLGKERLKKAENLVILNSSVYGPIVSLLPVFNSMKQKTGDFWGISYNRYCFPKHLQSYFFVFKKSILSSEEFYDYWNELPYFTDRNNAITNGEVKLTCHFESLGYVSNSFLPDLNSPDIDPMIVGLKKSRDAGTPFIKRSIYTEPWAIYQMNSTGQGDLPSTIFSELPHTWQHLIINDLYNNYDIARWGIVLKNTIFQPDFYHSMNYAQVYYSDNGNGRWTEKTYSGIQCGTTGRHSAISAIKFVNPSIEYRVYKKNSGWTPFCRNGEVAGDENPADYITSIEINPLVQNLEGIIQAHIEYKGWLNWEHIGTKLGNEEEALQIEAIKFIM